MKASDEIAFITPAGCRTLNQLNFSCCRAAVVLTEHRTLCCDPHPEDCWELSPCACTLEESYRKGALAAESAWKDWLCSASAAIGNI